MALPAPVKTRLQRLWDTTNDDYRRKLVEALPVGPELRLLDVGCHDGEFTQRLAARMGAPAENVAGIEIVEEWRTQAQARGFDVRAADLDRRWPFDDASFDVVHANQVIEHVARLDHFVGEVRRVLAPGGRAVICTENLASWHNIGALVFGFVPFSLTNISSKGPVGNPYALHMGEDSAVCEASQHVHVLTHVGLRSIFEMHDFEIVDEFASGYYPLSGRVGSRISQRLPKHAHFIGVVAQRP